jgi:hypothetical protein
MQFHDAAAALAVVLIAVAVAPGGAVDAAARNEYRAQLQPAAARVAAGETVELQLVRCETSHPARCTGEPAWASALANVSVNGVAGGNAVHGHATAINDGAASRVRYTAPAELAGGPVVLAVDLIEQQGAKRQVLVASIERR